MLESVLKIVEWLPNLFKYLFEKPQISIALEGPGGGHSLAGEPNTVRFKWSPRLVLHNDTPEVIRSVKLLQGFPPPWQMRGEIPTRLEPDQKFRIQLEAEIREELSPLYDRFGQDSWHKLRELRYPTFIAGTTIEIQFMSTRGRTFYQTTVFHENGTCTSSVLRTRHSARTPA